MRGAQFAYDARNCTPVDPRPSITKATIDATTIAGGQPASLDEPTNAPSTAVMDSGPDAMHAWLVGAGSTAVRTGSVARSFACLGGVTPLLPLLVPLPTPEEASRSRGYSTGSEASRPRGFSSPLAPGRPTSMRSVASAATDRGSSRSILSTGEGDGADAGTGNGGDEDEASRALAALRLRALIAPFITLPCGAFGPQYYVNVLSLLATVVAQSAPCRYLLLRKQGNG